MRILVQRTVFILSGVLARLLLLMVPLMSLIFQLVVEAAEAVQPQVLVAVEVEQAV